MSVPVRSLLVIRVATPGTVPSRATGIRGDQAGTRLDRSVTDAASRAGITATPTVLVNGREVGRTAEALRAAVAAG